MRRSLFTIAAAAALLSCQPTTMRPGFHPYPEAARTEIRLGTADATRRLADALRTDSIPISFVAPADGYLESRWFDSETGRPFDHRPVGAKIVRVRAWAERARPHASILIVETVYRPVADPSLPARELEHPVRPDHPIEAKIRARLDSLVRTYGGAPAGTSLP